MISNDTTHSPCILQEPDYTPSYIINNEEYEKKQGNSRTLDNGKVLKMDNLGQIEHYQINVACLTELGKYFDYMRENDVYDNTKIILVADHGMGLNQIDNTVLSLSDSDSIDVMLYNPLLMVKDFNSNEFVTDNSFMTHGDVPSIAFKDIIDKPINPSTGKTINNEKKQGIQYVFESSDWNIVENRGNTFLPGSWYSVHDNIFDSKNWKKIDNEPKL